MTKVLEIADKAEKQSDPVNHPSHYTWMKDTLGIEPIDIIEMFEYNEGAALGYIIRASRKGSYIQDLEKAVWHLNRRIDKLKKNETIVGGV